MNEFAARLRLDMAGTGPVVAPGVFSPLVGRLAAEAGFKAIYLTGAGVAGGVYGQPDLGVITHSEMLDVARRTVEVAQLPLICDAETGYGGVLNVRRTVRDLEAAGVAALHLEDQQFPRRCGFVGGHQLVSIDEMVTRLKAALDARRDGQTIIIASTEMFGATNLEDTIERASRYLEAGADLVFCNGVTSEEQAVRLAREIQADMLGARGWEMALAAERADARLTDVRLRHLRWYAGKLSPRVYGPSKAVEPWAAAGEAGPPPPPPPPPAPEPPL